MGTVYPRATACGDSAVIIEFGEEINGDINARVLGLDEALLAERPPGVIEAVPAYASLLIHYDPVTTSFEGVSATALALARGARQASPGRLRRVPICYEGEFGIDLPAVTAELRFAVDEFIERHSAPTYRVYMLGFQPGFAYLGGLDERLCLPRRTHIRHGAPAGTISIAASQCAVHAIDGPSGWHWIGRTPAHTYRAGEPPEFTFRAGDMVRFVPVTASLWRELNAAAIGGESIIEDERPCLC